MRAEGVDAGGTVWVRAIVVNGSWFIVEQKYKKKCYDLDANIYNKCINLPL